jgi:hypothetical protein
MIEKHNEHGLDLHMLFIEFKRAFDSINRERSFGAMDKMGIPQNQTYKNDYVSNQSKSENYNQISVPFEFNKGVKQGDGLSTTLFVLALHNAAQEINQRGTIYAKSSQICVYADDVVTVSTLETRLRQVYKEIKEKTQQM